MIIRTLPHARFMNAVWCIKLFNVFAIYAITQTS